MRDISSSKAMVIGLVLFAFLALGDLAQAATTSGGVNFLDPLTYY